MVDLPDRPRELERKDLGLESFSRQPDDRGLSLAELTQAFAAMLGSGEDPYAAPAGNLPDGRQQPSGSSPAAGGGRLAVDECANPSCEVTPHSILEAMLFVGHPDNEPLTSEQVASLMRGVRAAEIDELVRNLNERYAANGCPYRIASEGAGYRLLLREEYLLLRDKFYGRVRLARLSPAAIEVLAIVAYQGPLTGQEVGRLRGKPSGGILGTLVRRRLLRMERDLARTARYHTTERFLELFGLESLDDLPQSQEFDPPAAG